MNRHKCFAFWAGRRACLSVLMVFGTSAFAQTPNVSVTGPQSPEAELASFHLSDLNLKLELVAAEPDISSPVAFAWDADGRLFVAEMIGYPMTDGQCRIALLEDLRGTGQYSRTSTFADGLSYVTSVMPYRQGLLALSAPDLLYLEDTNGDGKADIRRVEWTGFGTGSQQLRANSLHWGLDNWIYGANGRCDGEIRRPDDLAQPAVSIRTRDFRFKPQTRAFEAVLGQSQFGQVHDDWGHRFLSWNTIPIRQVLLDESELGSYQSAASFAVINLADPADTGQIFPLSPPPRQFNTEQANYYNAMCGLCVYRGDALGTHYAGNAFVCESLTNLVTRRLLKPNGPSFVSRRAATESNNEFLASRDNWFHPVNLSTGPDGALYLADFYREFVEHPIYVADQKVRAETDWRKGSERGRLWRIAAKADPVNAASRRPQLSHAPIAELIPLLAHPVGWWRDTAQRLLIERHDQTAVPLLRQQLRQSESALGRSHSLWTLSGLDALTESDLLVALTDSEPAVQRQALRSLGQRAGEAPSVLKAVRGMSRVENHELRFQLALTARQLPADDAIDLMAELLEEKPTRELQLAVLCSSSTAQPWLMLRALLANDGWRQSPADWQITLLEQLAEQLATAQPTQIRPCLEWLARQSKASISSGAIAVLSGLSRGLESLGTSLNQSIAMPASNWAILAMSSSAYGNAAIIVASNPAAAIESRRAATDLLGRLRGDRHPQILLSLLNGDNPKPVQTAAARAIANYDDPALFRLVFQDWQRWNTAVRRDLLDVVASSSNGIPALIDAVADEHLTVNEIPNQIRDAALKHRDPAVGERARKLPPATTTANRNEVIRRYLPIVAQRGSSKNGAGLFKQHCLTCHSMRGVGQRVGPDLAGISSRRRDALLVDILDPSRQVTPDFNTYSLVTRQGRSFSGLIVAETADAVTIRRERGEQDTILRSDIEELRSSGKSMMPEGLENRLTLEQMADLLEFLNQPDIRLLTIE